MNSEKVRLVIRAANQVESEVDRTKLLELADEMLANYEQESTPNTLTGITFPVSIFRRYKGKLYEARLLKGRRVKYNGQTFNTPSSAAVFISGHPENGWRTWRYIDESTNKEEPIDRIRF